MGGITNGLCVNRAKTMKISLLLQYFLLFIGSCGICTSVHADQSQSPSHWQFSLAVGAGMRTNPVMDNPNIPLVLIPQINYQGERFFIQNLDFGYSLYETNQHEIHLLLTPSYDQVFFNTRDANNIFVNSQYAPLIKSEIPALDTEMHVINKQQLHQRRMTALIGFEYSYSANNFDFQLQALQDIMHTYNGEEARISLSKNTVFGKHALKFTVGANWQSAKTLNYFYGLNEQEAFNSSGYSPAAGITRLVRFDWSYALNEHWSLQLLASYKHLSDSITASPLITNDNVLTAFVGGVYHF